MGPANGRGLPDIGVGIEVDSPSSRVGNLRRGTTEVSSASSMRVCSSSSSDSCATMSEGFDARLGRGGVGKEGEGFDLADKWLKMGRVWVAAAACGKLERLLELATGYAAERKQFGQPIGKFQGVSFQLADMITDIDASDLLTLSAAWRLDAGMPANRQIASAKVFASEMLAKVTDTAIQVYGGMGLMNDLPLERFWRDARVERIWDGTSEIQRHIIARSLLRPLGA